MSAAASIVPTAPYTAPLFAEVLKQGARTFNVSRSMEDVIDKVFEQAEAAPPVQPQGPPPPDESAMQVEQLKSQTAPCAAGFWLLLTLPENPTVAIVVNLLVSAGPPEQCRTTRLRSLADRLDKMRSLGRLVRSHC